MDLTTFQPAPTPHDAQPTQQIHAVPEPAPQPQYETCDECGSPVDTDQRYCVVCGTRRRHVYDPAARFLSASNARNRKISGGPPRASGPRPRGRFQSVGTALAIAVIPVAIAVGVVLGKSGNSTDQKLLDALRSQKPAVVNVGGGALASTRSSGNGSVTSGGKHGRSASSKGSSSSTGKTLATTSNGTFTSLTATKPPSQTQLNQNENIVKKVQSTISQHYVDSQKNLPNSIAVP